MLFLPQRKIRTLPGSTLLHSVFCRVDHPEYVDEFGIHTINDNVRQRPSQQLAGIHRFADAPRWETF